MVTATDPAPPPADPDVEALVPRPSRVRGWALVLVAVIVLALAAVSRPVLRPELTSDAGHWGPVAGHVLDGVRVTTDGWPSTTVVSVGDVPGARVAEAWLLPDGTEGFGAPDGREATDARDHLAAMYPGADLDGARLPQRVGRGEAAWLVVLWDVTDCSALTDEQPEIRVRSVLGPTRAAESSGPGGLLDILSPAYDVQLLREEGVCPATGAAED